MHDKLIVKCWFLDSEEFIAKEAVKQGWSRKVIIRKVIDPLEYVTGRLQGMICPAQYEFYGKEELINKIKDYFETSEFDIEVV